MSEQYERGQADRRKGKPCYYGCHFGMRSTLERDKAEYARGWHDEDRALRTGKAETEH